MAESYEMIAIERCVQTEDFNTRTNGLGDISDLTESISKQGILQPLLGKNKENGNNEIEIYVGFRRLAAAKELGLKEVPVRVVPRRQATKKVMLLANVSENLMRDNLNPVDEALAFERMQYDHGMSTEDICRELGVKKSLVEVRFRILKLVPAVRDALHTDRITITAALEIDRLPADKQDRFISIAEELRGGKLTQLIDKELEKIQRKLEGIEPKKKKTPDAAMIAENAKTIKQANSVLCEGLGYDEEKKAAVLHVNFKTLDQDDLTVVAQFLDDCADQVEDEIPINDKAEAEIRSYANGEKPVLLNLQSGTVQDMIFDLVRKRAVDLAKESAKEKGMRARVTYAVAKQVIDECFVPDDIDEDGTGEEEGEPRTIDI